MKIIGAGFGRTGTSSLQAGLEELGFGPCYHMTEVIKQPWHARTWLAAAEGRPVNWKRLFRNYQATVDWPACEFYRELLAVYPEAKVLLSVRDPERWYESTANTIYAAEKARPFWFDWLGPYLRDFERMTQAIIWGEQGRFGGRFEDRHYALDIFNHHIEAVKQAVPAEQLLVYEVRQGWEPLCEFLEVPVPAKPFPHLNDTAQFRRLVTALHLARWLGPLLLVGLAVAGIYHAYRRRPARRKSDNHL